MQINCTVFIQIINFWITYLFLSKILLRPLINTLNKKESARKLLISHLTQKDLEIKHLLDKKNQELISFKNQIQAKYKAPPIAIPEIKTEFSYTHNPEKVKSIIALSKNIIVEKVSNAL